MIKRSLRIALALLLMGVWWCFTPSLFRAEFEFGIDIPDRARSKGTIDPYWRCYGVSRTLTAIGFHDHWEQGSHTTLIIPASSLVEFLDQFKRRNYSLGRDVSWSTDHFFSEPWLQEEVLAFRITEAEDGRLGDYLFLKITRLANDEFQCSIGSSWD